MKRTLTIAIMVLMAAIPVFAQNTTISKEKSPPKGMPSVSQILTKFVGAIGGEAANKKITNRVSKGILDVPAAGISGPFESYAMAPDSLYTIATLAGIGEFKGGYDGKAGWAADPMNGLRDMSGAEFTQMKNRADFYGALHFTKTFPKMVVKGMEKVGDHETYLVEASPSEGAPQKIYFDSQTGLIVRWDFLSSSPQGDFPTSAYFSNHREIDGVILPFAIRYENSASNYTVKFEEIKHNVQIDKAKFNKPSK